MHWSATLTDMVIHPPSGAFLILTCKATLTRLQASQLFQLRIGHIPLNFHLHRIHKAATAKCPSCNLAPETVHHLLLECPAYDNLRSPLFNEWKHLARDIGFLLSSPKAVPSLLKYVKQTGRLNRPPGEPPPQPTT